MKRIIAFLLAAGTCFSLAACGSKEEKAKESTKRIESAQSAINALHEIRYLDGFFDSLYLTEDAKIHHNEWTSAYVTAMDAYDALSSEEKREIKNAEWINENEIYVGQYEKILIEQEIALYCKEAGVEDLKERLVNKSSYEEYGWVLERSYYFEDEHRFWVELKIEYSATNKMGGRIDDTEYVDCKGTYLDGTITITELS